MKNKLIFRRSDFSYIEVNDIIKFHFFGRKFVVDSFVWQDDHKIIVDITFTTMNGKKTYRGYLRVRTPIHTYKPIIIGKKYWPREPLKYEEDVIYLINKN